MERATALMSNFIFYPVFILITVLLYWPSFWANYAWSGRRYSAFKFWGVGSYNVLCAAIHNFYVRDSTLPFMGHVDNAVMGWISLVMIFVHISTFPVEWERKRWFSRQ